MESGDDSRDLADLRFGKVPEIGRDPSLDEGQDLPSLGVESKKSGCVGEANRLKVPKERLNEGRVGSDWSADRISDPNDARRDASTGKRNLLYHKAAY